MSIRSFWMSMSPRHRRYCIEQLGCLFMFGKKCLAITPILGLLFTSLASGITRQLFQVSLESCAFSKEKSSAYLSLLNLGSCCDMIIKIWQSRKAAFMKMFRFDHTMSCSHISWRGSFLPSCPSLVTCRPQIRLTPASPLSPPRA